MPKLPSTDIVLKQFNHESKLTKIRLNNVLIDSGTSDCLVSAESLFSAPLIFNSLSSNLYLANALNQRSEQVISKSLTCNINLVHFDIEVVNCTFYVVEGKLAYEAILGMSVLRRLIIDFRSKEVKIRNVWSNNLRVQDNSDFIIKCNNLTLARPHVICTSDSIIGPFEENYVHCNAIECDKFGKNEELHFNSNQILSQNGLMCWPKFQKSRNLVKIKNFSEYPILIEKGALLGELVSVQAEKLLPDSELQKFCNFLVKVRSLPTDEQKFHAEEVKVWRKNRDRLVQSVSLTGEFNAIIKTLPAQFSDEMRKFFAEFDWNFSRTANDAGLSQHFIVDLILKPGDDQVPSYSRPYKNDPTVSKLIQDKVEEMKSALIVERCNSAWNSPVLSIRKKGGSIRLVNNYSSALNQRLLSGHFPLTPMRVLFGQISLFMTKMKEKFPGQKILMTGLDVRNGYYSLSLKQEKRDLTAFVIGEEQLRFRRLSQGLKTAPSDFSLFMKEIFYGINRKSNDFLVVSYLDDYALLASEDSHMNALYEIFGKVRENNLVIALNKCSFLQEKMDFLGFSVTQDGYQIFPSKVDALIKLPNPTTKKKAMQFMASFNFFARTVPRMAFYLKPLCYAITKPKFELTDQIRESLENLRQKLKEGKGTVHLSYEQPIFLCVDSSLVACGFALGNFKWVDGKPVDMTYSHFGSHVFEKAERYLSSRSRELLGISHALSEFSDLIPPSLEFSIFTDHQSLERISWKSDLGKSSFVTRIRAAYGVVLNYPRIRIFHLPGKSDCMQIADGISRLTVASPEQIETAEFDPDLVAPSVDCNVLQFETPVVTKEKIHDLQKSDPFVSKIRSEMAEKTINRIDKNGKQFLKINDLVYQRANANGRLLLIIPDLLSKDILNYLHVVNFHKGADALKNSLLKEPILIRNRSRLIAEISRFCLFCQISESSKFPEKNYDFRMRPTLKPFDKISVDLMHLSGGVASQYLLTFYDCFSTYLDCEVLKGKSAREVAKNMALLITRNGCQNNTQLLSDNGLEFSNIELKTLLKEYNCYFSHISPFNSRSSPVERAHRILRSFMRSMAHLPDISYKARMAVAVYNNQSRRSLDFRSPREILTGLPSPVIFPELGVDETPENGMAGAAGLNMILSEDGSDELEIREARSEWTDYTRAIHLEIGIQKYEIYNSFVSPNKLKTFNIGDLCLISDPIIKLSKNSNYGVHGPFIITKKNLNSYHLKSLVDNRTFIRNARHLKRLILSREHAEILKSQNFTLNDKNFIIPVPQEVVAEQDVVIEGIIKSSDRNLVQSDYNLRSRKKEKST